MFDKEYSSLCRSCSDIVVSPIELIEPFSYKFPCVGRVVMTYVKFVESTSVPDKSILRDISSFVDTSKESLTGPEGGSLTGNT